MEEAAMLKLTSRRTGLLALALLAAGCCDGTAHRRDTDTRASTAATAQPIVASYPVIVQIVSRKQTLIVSAGPDGALYSVRSPSGQELVTLASLDQLKTEHPEYYRWIEPLVANETSYVLEATAARE
jgi:hypothetical protein